MANSLYDTARENFLTGNINWVGNNIRAYLIDTQDYTYAAGDLNIDRIANQAKIATCDGVFSGKTSTSGVADANDIKFQAVTGDISEALIIWVSGATQTGSWLIAYIDSATNLPVTPNGGDITVTWDNGANKIFKL